MCAPQDVARRPLREALHPLLGHTQLAVEGAVCETRSYEPGGEWVMERGSGERRRREDRGGSIIIHVHVVQSGVCVCVCVCARARAHT